MTTPQVHEFRNKIRLYLQWALPSSGHPCPWLPPSPPSSWGIGHLCPVWWQLGNCLSAHTTDTHKCLIHAFGLDLGDSSLCTCVPRLSRLSDLAF